MACFSKSDTKNGTPKSCVDDVPPHSNVLTTDQPYLVSSIKGLFQHQIQALLELDFENWVDMAEQLRIEWQGDIFSKLVDIVRSNHLQPVTRPAVKHEPFMKDLDYEQLRQHYLEPVVLHNAELPNGMELRQQKRMPRIDRSTSDDLCPLPCHPSSAASAVR